MFRSRSLDSRTRQLQDWWKSITKKDPIWCGLYNILTEANEENFSDLLTQAHETGLSLNYIIPLREFWSMCRESDLTAIFEEEFSHESQQFKFEELACIDRSVLNEAVFRRVTKNLSDTTVYRALWLACKNSKNLNKIEQYAQQFPDNFIWFQVEEGISEELLNHCTYDFFCKEFEEERIDGPESVKMILGFLRSNGVDEKILDKMEKEGTSKTAKESAKKIISQLQSKYRRTAIGGKTPKASEEIQNPDQSVSQIAQPTSRTFFAGKTLQTSGKTIPPLTRTIGARAPTP